MFNLDRYKNSFSQNLDNRSILISKHSEEDVPLITIAIPTYKRPETLKEAIDSALKQDGIKVLYEIIVVDNEEISYGYTKTMKLMECYKNESRILYFRNIKNLGMFGNMNRCFELAKGEWVTLLHDDDLLPSSYVKDIIYYIEKKPDCGAICTEKIYFGERSKVFKRTSVLHGLLKHRMFKINVFDSFILNSSIYSAPTAGTIFNKKRFISMGGFCLDWGYSADWYGLIQLNKKYKIYKTIRQLGFYRVANNETLNIDTLISTIEDKKKLRLYFASKYRFAGKWYKYFEKSYIAIDVKNVLKLCDNKNKKIIIKKYKSFLFEKKIRTKLLQLFIKIYYIFKIF